ncbi:MAG TPA: glycosyltransferase family 39 protein [Verrucomicrobiae bacterium]|nr:glycosyltransferase family 39 protein [Verrucomicrobiae bacterium]
MFSGFDGGIRLFAFEGQQQQFRELPAQSPVHIFGPVFKKQAAFMGGLAGVFLSPFLFEPLAEIVRNYAPSGARPSDWWTYHLVFWMLSFVWAIYFGVWAHRSEWGWFSTGDLKKKLLWILTLGTLLRLLVVVFIDIPPASDAKAYDLLAQELAQTGSFQDGGVSTAFRPVGYPAFLAGIYKVFGYHLFLPKLANVFFDFLSWLLLWRLFSRWKDERTALKALAIVVFFIPELYSTQYLLAEQLFVFLWVLSLYFWETGGTQKYRPFLSGAAFGLAALVRPVVLFWIGLPVLFDLFKKRRLAALALVLGVFAALGPWIYRNHQKFGIWGLSGHAGINFWLGAHPGATGSGYFPELEKYPFDASTQKEMDRNAWRLGWEFVKNHPWEYVRLGLIKEAMVFGFEHNFVFDLWELPTHGQLVWGIFGQAYWWILLFFATVKGARVLFNRQERAEMGSWLPFWTLLYWVAVHFFFVGASRYHHPVVPFFAYFAALTVLSRPKEENSGRTSS